MWINGGEGPSRGFWRGMHCRFGVRRVPPRTSSRMWTSPCRGANQTWPLYGLGGGVFNVLRGEQLLYRRNVWHPADLRVSTQEGDER